MKTLQDEVEQLRRKVERLEYDAMHLKEQVQRWMQRVVRSNDREEVRRRGGEQVAETGMAPVDPISARILARRRTISPQPDASLPPLSDEDEVA